MGSGNKVDTSGFTVGAVSGASSDLFDNENSNVSVSIATLAALGENLDGQPIMPNSEMRNLIEEIVNGG